MTEIETIISDAIEISALIDLAHSCARGSYQRALLEGYQAWSGADLVGKAKKWSSGYAASRDALIERIDSALHHRGWKTGTVYDRRYHGVKRVVLTRIDRDAPPLDEVFDVVDGERIPSSAVRWRYQG